MGWDVSLLCAKKSKDHGLWLRKCVILLFSHLSSKHLSKAREGNILSASWLEGTKVHVAGTVCGYRPYSWDSLPPHNSPSRKLGQGINLKARSQGNTLSLRVHNGQTSATSSQPSDVQNCISFPSFPFR